MNHSNSKIGTLLTHNYRHAPSDYAKWCFLAIIGLLTTLIYVETPLYFDDLRFRPGCKLHEVFSYNGYSWMSFIEACDNYISSMWFNDPNRLANYISPAILCLLPHWAFAIISGALTCLIILLMCKLVGSKSLLGIAVMSFFVIFGLPWNEFMYSVMFSLNYIWSSVPILLTVWFITESFNGKSYSRKQFIFVCLTAIVAGWMHEGLSAPLLAGFTVYYIYLWRQVTRRDKILFLCLAIGVFLCFCGPDIWQRSDMGAGHDPGVAPLRWFIYYGFYNPVYFLFIISLVLSISLWSGWSKLSKQQKGFLLLIAVTTSAPIYFFFRFHYGERVIWMSRLLSPVGCLYLFNLYKTAIRHKYRTLIALICGIAPILNLGFAVIEQHKCRKEALEILSLYDQSETGSVFYDKTQWHLTPALGKSSLKQFSTPLLCHYLSVFLYDSSKHFVILPTAFRKFSPVDATPMPSTEHLFTFDNHLISNIPPENTQIEFLITDSHNNTHRTKCEWYSFQDASNNTWYIFEPMIYPFRNFKIEYTISDAIITN